MNNIFIKSIWRIAAYGMLIIPGMLLSSCKDEDDSKPKIKGGTPEIYYIRMTEPGIADSLLVSAYMDNTICLVGSNLKSIKELWFNDQQAVLNTSMITDKTLLVNVPKGIPSDVTDKIYMIANGGTVEHNFKVLVPEPIVVSMSCEYAHEGDEAIIYGDYFIDDPNKPLSIKMAGNVDVKDFISINKTEIKFRIPEGSQRGYVNVTSLYGTGRSRFQYLDNRNLILDWDQLNANGGWRPGDIFNSDPDGISGNYVRFHGSVKADGQAGEDGLSFNLWNGANGREGNSLIDVPMSEAVMKFEVNVVNPWTAGALQMIFTNDENTNSYIWDTNVPRALWKPWVSEGSYISTGWTTVTIPLSDFKYTHEGNTIDALKEGKYTGLTFFVFGGADKGQDCDLNMCIDNIRVVPAQ